MVLTQRIHWRKSVKACQLSRTADMLWRHVCLKLSKTRCPPKKNVSTLYSVNVDVNLRYASDKQAMCNIYIDFMDLVSWESSPKFMKDLTSMVATWVGMWLPSGMIGPAKYFLVLLVSSNKLTCHRKIVVKLDINQFWGFSFLLTEFFNCWVRFLNKYVRRSCLSVRWGCPRLGYSKYS